MSENYHEGFDQGVTEELSDLFLGLGLQIKYLKMKIRDIWRL